LKYVIEEEVEALLKILTENRAQPSNALVGDQTQRAAESTGIDCHYSPLRTAVEEQCPYLHGNGEPE